MERTARVTMDGGWAKKGFLSGLLNTFKQPGDVLLALRIAIFVTTMPKRLASQPQRKTARIRAWTSPSPRSSRLASMARC